MKAPGGRWCLLLLVATAWAQGPWVSVTCGRSWLSVTVPVEVLGSPVATGELRLGATCGVTATDGDRYRLEHPLGGCGTTLELLPNSILYTNVLHYRPMARAGAFSIPVGCSYPRTGRVSSRATQPTWIPLGSTIAHRRRPRFALAAYDSTWSSRLHQPSYSWGELINVEASVGTSPLHPIRVLVDNCVATTHPPAWHQLIACNGCLLAGQLGRSRFLPWHGDGSLRFQLDTSLFPNTSSSQIHLRCHLQAVAPGAGGTLAKACSYDLVTATWHSLDGDNCPGGCGGRRRRAAGGPGLLGEATVHLGPLQLLSSSPVPSMEVPTVPPHGPSVPVVREEQRDSEPAVPAATLAMVAMCCVLVAVAMAGCYRSLRRHRLGDPSQGSPGATSVAMATTVVATTPGDPIAV